MKILVTGSEGFLGSEIINVLSKKKISIKCGMFLVKDGSNKKITKRKRQQFLQKKITILGKSMQNN